MANKLKDKSTGVKLPLLCTYELVLNLGLYAYMARFPVLSDVAVRVRDAL